MIQINQILSFLNHPLLWRLTGFISSIIGLLCYASSSSFKHLFGDWNLLKIFLYGIVSFITCCTVLLAKKFQLSRSLILKAHVGFLALMLTSIYSFFYDKEMTGKSDILGLISCAAFALMSLSLSRQIDIGFEVDLLNFFLGCLTVQLMSFNLMLASIGGVFCYFVFVLRSSLDLVQQGNESVDVTVTDHVAIEIESVEIRANHDQQELASLRKRLVSVLGTKNMCFFFEEKKCVFVIIFLCCNSLWTIEHFFSCPMRVYLFPLYSNIFGKFKCFHLVINTFL